FEALRHQKAADGKEHEDADEAEDRLVAGQPDQRLVVLRALGDQEGVREDDRDGGDQTQRVEIVLSALPHSARCAHAVSRRATRARGQGRSPRAPANALARWKWSCRSSSQVKPIPPCNWMPAPATLR